MKAPASAIFWLNLWYMISCFGWLLQFLKPGIRDVIVCKKDGTLRINESRYLLNVLLEESNN